MGDARSGSAPGVRVHRGVLRRRLHSSLGYLTPADYEYKMFQQQSAAHAA